METVPPWNRFAVSSVFLPPSPRAPSRTDINSTRASGSAGPLLADPLFFPHGGQRMSFLEGDRLIGPALEQVVRDRHRIRSR